MSGVERAQEGSPASRRGTCSLAVAPADLAWRFEGPSDLFSLFSFSLCYHDSKAAERSRNRLQTMRNFIRNPNTDNDLIHNLFVVTKKLINVSTEKAGSKRRGERAGNGPHMYILVLLLYSRVIHITGKVNSQYFQIISCCIWVLLVSLNLDYVLRFQFKHKNSNEE